MDGNRRFGKASQQASAGPAAMWEKSPACRRADALMAGSNTPLSGHYAGGEKLMEFILWCIQWRIEMLTVYAFSTENWSRPPEEISLLMLLFEHFFERIRAMSKQHGIFIRFVSSDPHLLSPRIQRLMAAVEEEARRVPHRRIVVNVCVSYGGRSEIIRACCAAAAAAGATRSFKSGEQCSRKGSQRHAGASAPAISGMLKTEVTEADVTRHMLRSVTQSDHEAEDAEILSGGLGEPQALLRTSGEQRISNFLLWQSAYSELFFLKKTWPELTSADLAAVLGEFESRQRRFGK
jgi:undecaprenyl diphosphate synthase